MKVYVVSIVTLFLCISCGGRNESKDRKVGNISVPSEVTMRSYSFSEPNYQKGNCVVTITELPQNTMKVIKYIWVEDVQKGLKSTAQKVKTVPAVVFDDVAEGDAKRIVMNLKKLGCMAAYESKQHE